MRLVGYARVSLDKQADKGQSLEVQEHTIRKYAEANGHEIVDMYIDAGVSGGTHISTRPEGGKMMRRLAKGGIDAVVLFKLDRGFRDTLSCLSVVSEWDKKNVGLVILDMSGSLMDTKSPMGRFFLQVMASIGELERNITRERTKVAIEHKKTSKQLYSSVPMGYRVDDEKNLIPVEAELDLVRRIYAMKAGGMGYRGIARQLNEEGVPTKAGGKMWYPNTVSHILKNDLYSDLGGVAEAIQ